jgi:hypothetical protein
MIELGLLLGLEASDSAMHLNPGLRPWVAGPRPRERAGDSERRPARHGIRLSGPFIVVASVSYGRNR